jgi:membrane protease YdiL (CAAX protease family)
MSISLAQDTLTANQQAFYQVLYIAGGLAIAAIFAALAGVFRRKSVLGSRRLSADQPVWPIGISAVVGVIVWIGIQGVYVGNKQVHFALANPGQTFDVEKNLTAEDYAFLATLPAAVAFCVLLLMDRILGVAKKIFPSLRRLPAALAQGSVGFLVVFPLLLASGVLLELFYNAVHYPHPDSHELLGAMKGVTNPVTKALLILGACVAAPVFEEYFFRGHVQTFLAQILDPSPKIGIAVEGDVPSVALPALSSRSSSRIWGAILLTSFFFAIVHPMWMAPLIFLLSICLGYAYERTGNIWVPIVIHALFNTVNTIQFLYFM